MWQPVRFAVVTQLQAGLNAVLRLALQLLYLVLLQRLRDSLPERSQAHRVLMTPGLHKRQVRVVQVALRVQGPDVGIADIQSGRGCQRHQVPHDNRQFQADFAEQLRDTDMPFFSGT